MGWHHSQERHLKRDDPEGGRAGREPPSGKYRVASRLVTMLAAVPPPLIASERQETSKPSYRNLSIRGRPPSRKPRRSQRHCAILLATGLKALRASIPRRLGVARGGAMRAGRVAAKPSSDDSFGSKADIGPDNTTLDRTSFGCDSAQPDWNILPPRMAGKVPFEAQYIILKC